MQLPLPIASYRLPSPAASSALLVNCYAQVAPPDSPKGRVILRRAPGIRPWCEVAGDSIAVRGAIVMNDVLYALIGTTVYSIDQNGAATALSGSVPGSERVRMATNGTSFVIVRPTNNLAYSSDGSTVSQITDGTFLGWGAADVDILDGFYVFRRPDSNQVFNSGLNALTFNGLDFTSFDAAPGDLNGLIVDNREIIGTKVSSTELWYNAGRSPGSPFARSPQGFREIGSAASYSLGKQDNSVFWLANDRTFRRMSQSSQKVSQPGIEAMLERLPRIDDCFALPYTVEGHLQIAWTFPFANRTIVYDCTTDQWHDRESLGLGRWRANLIVRAYGQQLVGDSQSGRIGILDPDTHEEWGEPQRVEWTYQPVYGENRRVSHQRFELVLNVGSGVTSGQGQNPLATLKISDDGGNTFRALPTRSLGEIGKYKTTVDWWKLGSAKQRVYRVEITDPVPLYIADTQVLATGAVPFHRSAYG